VLCGSRGQTVSVHERCPFPNGVFPSYILLLAVTRAAKNAVGVLSCDGPEKRRANQGRGDCGWPRHIIWVATAASESVNFLDFTIILRRGQIKTRTFQKEMNLYLYRPPPHLHPLNPRASFTDSSTGPCTAYTGRIPGQSGSPTS
jgi:hypothetical protein